MKATFVCILICIGNILSGQDILEVYDGFTGSENFEYNAYLFFDKDLDDQYYLFLKANDGHIYRINSFIHSWKCDCGLPD